MEATGDASDALSVVLHGMISTMPGGDGNPFLVEQIVAIDSMDFLFLKPGNMRSAGNCSFYLPDDSIMFKSTPVAQ